jgi:hypothetical protein
MIKSGIKYFEYRDAHITFVCEETGEQLRKEVTAVRLTSNQGKYMDCCTDDMLIEFKLSFK